MTRFLPTRLARFLLTHVAWFLLTTSTPIATALVSRPDPISVCSAPAAAITGPPISSPAELPALTTTDCPDNNARRSAPADDLVIRIEIAAIPSTTVAPDSAPKAATAAGVVQTPIPIQPSPIQAQAIAAIGIGETRLTTAREMLVPTTAPTPYPDIPAAR